MECKIDFGPWNGVFAVPNDVIDKYIKLASGVNIKVLLILLRNSGNSVNTAEIASLLSIDEEEVKDAVMFWQQMSIIPENMPLQSKSDIPVNTIDRSVDYSKNDTTIEEQIAAARRTAALRKPDFSPKQIAETLLNNPEMNYLFKTTESLYGRVLKHTEENALVCIVDEIGLPVEVAMMMVKFCFSIDKATPSYMKSVAEKWVSDGITTLSSAEERISELEVQYGAEGTIKRLFELSRALTQKEKEFADTWVNKMKFSKEMILEAYEINVNLKGKASFPYIGKILENWYSKGISTKEQLAEYKEQRMRQEPDVSSSLNFDKIEDAFFEEYE